MTKCEVISGIIVANEMFPLGFFGKLLGAPANRGTRLFVHPEIVVNVGAHRVGTFKVIIVIAVQNTDTVRQAASMS